VVCLALLAGGLAAAAGLGLFSGGGGRPGGLGAIGDFLAHAVHPSLVSEAPAPFGGGSLLPDLLAGVRETVVFAAAGLALAMLLGLPLGLLGSSALSADGGSRAGRTVRTGLRLLARGFASAVRSVHELVWAVLFLAALGRSDAAAVAALALPYAGNIAKVFAELIDEAPRAAGLALRAAGAPAAPAFAIGVLPRLFPDLVSFLFYEFECLLRSSAVLGFFGFPTLGYLLAGSFENLYHGEVWTYLFALLALLLLVEGTGAAVRRRLGP
jgi:phosphonate transport system permease protein